MVELFPIPDNPLPPIRRRSQPHLTWAGGCEGRRGERRRPRPGRPVVGQGVRKPVCRQETWDNSLQPLCLSFLTHTTRYSLCASVLHPHDDTGWLKL